MEPFTIAQITDLHIGKTGELPYDTDVRGNFLSILENLDTGSISLLVISGDLCFREPEPAIYRWIREELEKTGIPYIVMNGNHDDPRILAREFDAENDLHDDGLYGERRFGWGRMIFLDGAAGRMPSGQLSWLSSRLRDIPRDASLATLVFVHYPPVLAGVRFMDERFPLVNGAELRNVLSEAPQKPLPVFCGHYHAEKTVLVDGLAVFITPASFFQIDQEAKEFRIDHAVPGWRLITVENGDVRTTVRYLRGIPHDRGGKK